MLTEAQLSHGILTFSADCPVCRGTGQVQFPDSTFLRVGELCECVESVAGLFREANFPQRFAGIALAELDWTRLGPNVERAIKRYAEQPDYIFTQGIGLILTGKAGTGKTHTAVGLAKLMAGYGYPVRFFTVATLLEKLRAGFADRSAGATVRSLWEQVYHVDLLVLDDLGVENITDWARQTIYQIVNERWLARLPTIATTNSSAEVLQNDYGPGTLSRLMGSSLVIQFSGSDYRVFEKKILVEDFLQDEENHHGKEQSG